MGRRFSKRTIKEESSDEEEEASDEEAQVVVAKDEEEEEEDTSEDEDEEGDDTSEDEDKGFSGSMEPPLLVETQKDAASAAHLQHWHRCRDLMAYKEPIGADAKRQLVLFLKGRLPSKEFAVALTLLHGVCVAGNKAIGNNNNNGSDSSAALGSNYGDGSDSAGTNNKRHIDNTPAGLQVATKKPCIDRAQAPPAESSWGRAPKPAESTWGAPGASLGTPVPKVTPAETRWVRKSIPAPQQPHSHGSHYQNGHSLDNRHQRGRSPHHNDDFQRHHSPHDNNRWSPHHSPNHNQHHHHAPDRNHHFQRHRSSHDMNDKRF
jgi:hypothetical protein